MSDDDADPIRDSVIEGTARMVDLANAHWLGQRECVVGRPSHEESASMGRPCPICHAVV